ncbi:hypothetical protein OsI_18458 [Oryza sativa Indica Group]|uniref:Uncharacterized protein n=1 Tax=Oryza sativa subsp. indica TaxID=39946 RepID=B8AY73_ORYSI|nr:hypothetical protein OsI_18458 [Oryza sativa Indica Group]
MDRLSRPASPAGGYARRGSGGGYGHHYYGGGGGGSAQTSPPGGSPTASPVHRHARTGSLGGAGAASTVGRRGRAHNTAARAAAQRLARVMASTDGAGVGGGGGGVGGGGDGGSGSDDDEYELSGPPIELSSTPRRTGTRSPSPSAPVSRPPSLTNRYTPGKSVPMIPSIKQQNRPATSGPGSESPAINRREQRRSVDLGSSLRARRTSSSLHDEINSLQVETEGMYEKFNLAEERSEEGDAKSMHMAAVIADAIEPEANLISRKDAALQQRKASLRSASRRSNSASCDEIAALRSEAKRFYKYDAKVKKGSKSPSSEGQNPPESLELVCTRTHEYIWQSWLTYFWRRAKSHDIEEDIADERLQFWIEQGNHPVSTIDIIEVERGLTELRKLGIESQLWESTRRSLDDDFSNHGSPTGSEI